MNHRNLSIKRLSLFDNIKRIENKKKYKNRLKHLRRDYEKLSKRIDNIVWNKMSRKIQETEFLYTKELEDAFLNSEGY